MKDRRIANHNKKIWIICLLTAIGIITVCSKSSILYPFNDWVDSNCFFTVGKSMMNGVVVYRDLLEQKGPFLYFLHGIGWLISQDTFFGVYLIEILAAFLFLYFSYRTMEEICDQISPAVIPVLTMLIYTVRAFCHGDSAEELCLPFLGYAIWILVKSCKEKEEISLKHFFIIGICSGCVFWTKFTLVGLYIGWFLVPAVCFLWGGRWKQLMKAIGSVAGGVLLATIPYMIYFGRHHAIDDWLKVYLLDNIFSYSTNIQDSAAGGMIENLSTGWRILVNGHKMIFLFCLLGFGLILFRQCWKMLACYICMFAVAFAFIYMGGRYLPYYPFILTVFVPIGMAVIWKIGALLLEKILDSRWLYHKKVAVTVAEGIILIICIGAAAYMTPNRYLRGVEKSELPQYQFKEIIEQVEEPTLLNYGFLDGGFYTVTNIIPNCKAFCRLNVPLEEMYMLQDYYAQMGLCDFIVTRNKEVDFEGYELVATNSFMFENMMFDYRLYQLKE